MTILGNAASVRGTPANEKIVMAVVGVRGRGSSLAPGLRRAQATAGSPTSATSTARLFASRGKLIADAQGGKQPKCVQDFRKALDDKSVDAMVIATPDHWHVPAAIWGCQAGKDVYVEKPLSHNCWEGRKLVEAARKYQRIVQVGTQNRSAPYNMAAKQIHRGRQAGPDPFLPRLQSEGMGQLPPGARRATRPPGSTGTCGTARRPSAATTATYVNNWHHLWRYSGGDMANDASHQIDLARWVLGLDYPKSVYSVGGRFDSRGAAETPDTQTPSGNSPT